VLVPASRPLHLGEAAALSPAPDSIPVAVPLLAAAFAAFVFAKQRRPSILVRLHLARPEDPAARRGFVVPRLVLSPRQPAAPSTRSGRGPCAPSGRRACTRRPSRTRAASTADRAPGTATAGGGPCSAAAWRARAGCWPPRSWPSR